MLNPKPPTPAELKEYRARQLAKYRANKSPETKYTTFYGVTFAEVNTYGLACGYLQKITNHGPEDSHSLILKTEHSHFHVQYIDYSRTPTPEELEQAHVMDRSFYMEWHTFSKTTDARAKFKELLKTHQNQFKQKF